MNIFVLDRNPTNAAEMMCDKHVVKMIVESCQLLSTAHHVLDGQEVTIDSGKRKYKTYICSQTNICKATMINHPCTIWTRRSRANYAWLWQHANSLCKEYTNRYVRQHSMEQMLQGSLNDIPKNIDKGGLTDFAQAMPDAYKHEDVVAAYRAYYLGEKARFAKWRTGNIPNWWLTKNEVVV
jgi:hypothetical protein